jgi:hypothetical protein
MVRRKQSADRSERGGRVVKTIACVSSLAPETSEMVLVSAPKLRRMIGVSAVTLWRWRHDEDAGFPPATTINGRNYFPWPAVAAWLAARA